MPDSITNTSKQTASAGFIHFTLLALALLLLVPACHRQTTHTTNVKPAVWAYPIEKQGYLGSPVVEVTPLPFDGELYLLENWRSQWVWPGSPDPSVEERAEIWMTQLPEGPGHYDRRLYLGRVLTNCTLGTALIWDDRVYVYAVNSESSGGGRDVMMTWTDDMRSWSEPVKVFESPAGKIFNVAVTRDEHGLTFLWETNGLGVPFTMCFGRVSGPADPWGPGVMQAARYGMGKYTGGPALYYTDGWYYLLYLESLPGRGWETRITRSRNLEDWQDAPEDRPFVTFNSEKTHHPLRPSECRENNASDAEVALYDGQALIYFTGSDQTRGGDLQWATYEGTPETLFQYFFEGVDEPEE